MTDEQKLRMTADWFEYVYPNLVRAGTLEPLPNTSDEVQRDLRAIADRLATLTRENERLRELLKSLSVRYDAEGACVWFCECCNAESDTHGDIQHAPDCLAYGGERAERNAK